MREGVGVEAPYRGAGHAGHVYAFSSKIAKLTGRLLIRTPLSGAAHHLPPVVRVGQGERSSRTRLGGNRQGGSGQSLAPYMKICLLAARPGPEAGEEGEGGGVPA